ncbi:tetratricopeptide repeat protein [Streptomyces venezuelae]|uniref:tetratricopeptide repeat protein n=1 Tax=Streptomyces venezuelae TaxID=54571 RepID=UPI00278C5840|nr:tetratricopeptide repeat protein [Streptomyces venezuelae]
MAKDRYGNTLHACTPEAAGHLDRAVTALLHFSPEVAPAVEDAVASAPTAPVAQSFAAYLGLLGTEAGDAAEARKRFHDFAAATDRSALPVRDRLHMAAAGAWLAGDLSGAADHLEELSLRYPRDALALAVGHQLDFFTGDAVRLRDRIGAALSEWDTAEPHRGMVLGMYAFGLEESGHYARAEEAGLAAVQQNPRDVWAIHAVVHTYEMQGRVADGIGYLDARLGDWADGNYLNVHNWWHYALYALEAGDTDTALRIYDAAIHNEESEGLAMELLDASALLWRFHLAGIDQAARWEVLADAWAARADPPYYAFNDVHAVMSYAGCGRLDVAERLVADRRQWLARAGAGGPDAATNHRMTADIGLPVCEALVAHARGRHRTVVELLLPLRRRLHAFGGSHAQRDAVQRTLVDSALRAGRHDLTRALLGERIGLRPDSRYDWLTRADLADALGDAAHAAVARERAHATEVSAAQALHRRPPFPPSGGPGVTGLPDGRPTPS